MDLLLKRLHLPRLKLSSGDLTNAPLLLQIAKEGAPLILSTGMAALAEVELALAALAFGYSGGGRTPSKGAFYEAYGTAEGQKTLRERVVLLHCTTEYPALPADVNLRAMDTLRQAFGLSVGYSDHTRGTAVSLAAVARGATVIEKHLTLDRTLAGPDHRASLEPDEFGELVEGIRAVQKALGSARKLPTAAEEKNKIVARKSLVAARPIAKGEPFTVENVALKRPGDGLSPFEYWSLLGEKASRDFAADERLRR